MKNTLIILMLIVQNYWTIAQSTIEQDIDVAKNQRIILEFDEASIVHVSEWDEQYIHLSATVSINDDTQNEAYKVHLDSDNDLIVLSGLIQDKEKIPQVIRIKKGDEVFTFQTDDWDDPSIKDFYKQHGDKGIQWKSHGLMWHIDITINVPKNKTVTINSKHGIIELANLSGEIQANSIHGGIDLTINENARSEIDARTKWGTIYSNIKLNINENLSSDNEWNHIVGATSGNQPKSSFNLESKHANIYLRY